MNVSDVKDTVDIDVKVSSIGDGVGETMLEL